MKKTFLEHVEELRGSVKRCMLVLFACSFAMFLISPSVVNSMKENFLPQGWELVITDPTEVLIVELMVSLLLGFALSFPYILYETMRFLYPALLPKERKLFKKYFMLFSLLFVAGCIFSTFLFIPLTFKVLSSLSSQLEVKPMITLISFFNFTVMLTLSIGLLFNLPLFLLFLNSIGLISPEDLEKNRSYVLLGLLFILSILTPDPTPLTTLILFFPLWLLYEISLLLIGRSNSRKKP